MRFIYFDEVKYQPPRQPRHWIGALSIDARALQELERQVNDVAAELFGTRILSRETEFHAVDMVQGAAHFRGRKIEDRLSALEKLLSIANNEAVRRISVSVIPERMVAPGTAAEKAFVFFVEKAQLDLAKSKDTGILVGDLDTDYADEGVSNLSHYRDRGTPYHFGRSIDRLLDSVYFIPSHHSRMVQLADTYAYVLQLLHSPPENDRYPKARLRQFVREQTNLGWANSYKDWPSNDSWMLASSAA